MHLYQVLIKQNFNIKAQTKAVTLTVARYLKEEKFPTKPSIRICVNVDLSEQEIDLIVDTLKEALSE